jgi:hypothetical protein
MQNSAYVKIGAKIFISCFVDCSEAKLWLVILLSYHFSTTTDMAKNECRYNATPPYAFMARVGKTVLYLTANFILYRVTKSVSRIYAFGKLEIRRAQY